MDKTIQCRFCNHYENITYEEPFTKEVRTTGEGHCNYVNEGKDKSKHQNPLPLVVGKRNAVDCSGYIQAPVVDDVSP